MRSGLHYAIWCLMAVAVAAITVEGWRITWPHDHFVPPKIAKPFGQSTSYEEDRLLERQMSMALTARYPTGTDVSKLKAELIGQGFYLHSAFVCKEELSNAAQTGQETCTTATHDILEYDWEHLPCALWIQVIWADDSYGRLVEVFAHYGRGC